MPNGERQTNPLILFVIVRKRGVWMMCNIVALLQHHCQLFFICSMLEAHSSYATLRIATSGGFDPMLPDLSPQG
jgi:hypothetical protein